MLGNITVKVNIKKIKKNIYLIIPMSCIIFWAILFLLLTNYYPNMRNFQFLYMDFQIWYRAGQEIYTDPSNLYYKHPEPYNISYTWMPCWAMLFAISISLMPYAIGYFILYTINILAGMFFVREFNKVLTLLNIKKKFNRFLFLIIVSNGFIILNVFLQNQPKLIIALIFTFILRREIQFRKEEIVKDLKYYLINYGLFVFAVGLAPYFIFFLLIYIFHDIKFNDLLKKQNCRIYLIVFFMFVAQNFLFVIYPNLIFDFLDGFYKNRNFWLFYLNEFIFLTDSQITLINFIFTILLFIITLILIINKNLKLEVKFGYFSLFAIFFGLFANRVLNVLLPFVLILFIPFLNQEEKGTDYIKKNFILLTGFIAIAGIYLNINTDTIYNIITSIFPFTQGSLLYYFIYLRWILLLSIMVLSLLVLHLKNWELMKEWNSELSISST